MGKWKNISMFGEFDTGSNRSYYGETSSDDDLLYLGETFSDYTNTPPREWQPTDKGIPTRCFCGGKVVLCITCLVSTTARNSTVVRKIRMTISATFGNSATKHLSRRLTL
ncbi:unnamed protein product [Arabis nemorensis]|uniref:Uncharacterized protein n=1 Tax=Arabis nemorensis TaxID=586526 RepID=A0A565BIT5_9BRAS|nr:unnamed protein product [Arabis nemorensis]